MPIGGGLASAKLARVGFGGYALAVTSGLAIGIFCAWIMWVMGKIMTSQIELKPVPLRERYALLLYIAAIMWIAFALFLGNLASVVLMRLVS